jgi:hypothetical protein
LNFNPLENFPSFCHNPHMTTATKKKRPRDINQLAFQIVQEATGEDKLEEEIQKNIHAMELGRLGGLKGGKARMSKLTPDERRELARRAAKARWGKKAPQSKG